MRARDIPLRDVRAGKNWVIPVPAPDPLDSGVEEALVFYGSDLGLFSAAMEFHDGTAWPALILKSLAGPYETYAWSRKGWTSMKSEGIFRILGKYAHDVYPLKEFLANPWEGDAEFTANAEEHRRIFRELAGKFPVADEARDTSTRLRRPGGPSA